MLLEKLEGKIQFFDHFLAYIKLELQINYYRRDIIRAIVGQVQQPEFEIIEPNAAAEQLKRFPPMSDGQPDSNSDGTDSVRDDATVLSEAAPSTAGWSNDSFDTMISNRNSSRPQIDVQYVANLLDYKHVVSVLEQPVSSTCIDILTVIMEKAKL